MSQPYTLSIVKNNDIYTANDHLSMLRQMLPNDSNYSMSVKAASGYHLNEKEEPTECKVITLLDDILKYTEHSEYTQVYDGHDLLHSAHFACRNFILSLRRTSRII